MACLIFLFLKSWSISASELGKETITKYPEEAILLINILDCESLDKSRIAILAFLISVLIVKPKNRTKIIGRANTRSRVILSRKIWINSFFNIIINSFILPIYLTTKR